MYNFFDPEAIGRNTTLMFCRTTPQICSEMLKSFGDPDPKVDNLERAETIITHIPSGAGWRNFFHYGQIINSTQFQRYDFGPLKNFDKYG